MDDDDVHELLKSQVKHAGSAFRWAVVNNIAPSNVTRVLSGEYRRPSPKVLAAMGLRKVVSYEPSLQAPVNSTRRQIRKAER